MVVSYKIIFIKYNIAKNNVCSYHIRNDRHRLANNKVSHANRKTVI